MGAPVAKLRRGMTLSGDDLYPARMRNLLFINTCVVDDDNNNRPTADDITKRRNKPSEPTSETATIHHSPLEQSEQQKEESGELERRRKQNSYQHFNKKDEDSGKSTSDDYTSDYEDSGAKFRWRDESVAKRLRQRDVRHRRSYMTRRRRDVKRSQSDPVRVSRLTAECRTGQGIIFLRQQSKEDKDRGLKPGAKPESSAEKSEMSSSRDGIEHVTGQESVLCQHSSRASTLSADPGVKIGLKPRVARNQCDDVDIGLHATSPQHAGKLRDTLASHSDVDVKQLTADNQSSLKNLGLQRSKGRKVKSEKMSEGHLEVKRVIKDIPARNDDLDD